MSFRRLAETDRRAISFMVDGRAVTALEGDTYLTAIRLAGLALRWSEFGDGPRAGFCLMGACQDCWIWTEDGERLRACSTTAEADARLLTSPDAGIWPCPTS
jgi:aerobic-type carbon monoxide dehydrogenase small subunit (CoxS/CutS family)